MSDTASTVSSSRRALSPDEQFAVDQRLGNVLCDNREHAVYGKYFPQGKTSGPKFHGWRPRPKSDVAAAMIPFKPARCACEREAVAHFAKHPVAGTYQTEWFVPGNNFKGLKFGDKVPDVPKKVMPIAFSLNDEQRKQLMSKFPDWIFYTTRASGHDHPVAHASAQIATHTLVSSLPSGKYLDVYGDPAANQRHNQLSKGRTIDTAVTAISPKDWVRQAFKWGDAPRIEATLRDLGKTMSPEMERRMAKYDGLLMFQALYYCDLNELVDAINATKGKKLTATIHRFNGESGKINAQEQTWERFTVKGREYIRQTNVQTGEMYQHLAPDMWFRQTCWAASMDEEKWDDRHSLAWTVNKSCDDTYVLQITTIPNKVAAWELQSLKEYAPPAPAESSSRWVDENGAVTFRVGEVEAVVPIASALRPTFDKLRLAMTGKERTPDTFKAHVQRTVNNCSKVIDQYTMTATEVHDLALASFWVDAKRDLVDQSSVSRWYSGFENTTARLLKNGPQLDTNHLRLVAKAAIAALDAKNTKDGVRRLIQLSLDHKF